MNKVWIFLLAAILFNMAKVNGQVNFQPGYYTMTYSTQSIEPALVEVIDGVATMHYSMPNSTINGSPYLSEEFVDGAMITANGVRIEGLKFRYDIYSDEMQFILKNDTASITKPLILNSVELGNRKFVYDVYQISDHLVAAGYFEVMNEGNLSVLLRRELELEYDIYVPNYGGGGGTKEFMLKENNNFYIKTGRSAAQKVYRKKDFLKAIPSHHDRVSQYIKANRISVRKEKDIYELATYYNSL